jgi:glycerol kinase
MAYQAAVNVETLKSGGLEIPALKIDGAAVSNDWLCQFQADILGIPVQRPTVVERTALGVAHIAGAAANLWDLNSISERWELEREFEPTMSHDERENLLAGWSDAVTAAQSLPPRRI